MRKIQIEKLKEFHSLIIKEKLTRDLIPIKEYSIYKKNSQIKICIKYKNCFSHIVSVLFSIQLDGSWFVNTKENKFKYENDYKAREIFKEIENSIIKEIKYPKKEYNKYPIINKDLFNKIILKELKKFKYTTSQRISLTRSYSYFDNHLLIIRSDKNIEVSETKSISRLKTFKKDKITLQKEAPKLSDILKELE